MAAGIKINDGQTREEKTGINSRYYVDAGLKLEDGGVYGLLVRNAIDKLKKPTNVIDFTAPSPLSKIEDTSSAYRTRQYPLRDNLLVVEMFSKVILRKLSRLVKSIGGIRPVLVLLMTLGVQQVARVSAISVVVQVMAPPVILTTSSTRIRRS